MNERLYTVSIQRQKRKSLAMRRTRRGVEVRVPDELDPAGERVQAFIETGLGRLQTARQLPNEPLRSAEDVYARVAQWANQLDVRPGRVQVQPMRRKWASMSTRGNLTLASDVLHLPQELLDYVVVHELLHLKFPNHRKGFRAAMDYTLPDWSEQAERLESYAIDAEGWGGGGRE